MDDIKWNVGGENVKIELFEMAEKLQRDIQSLKRIIKDVETESH